MPFTMIEEGELGIVKKVAGKAETKKFLEKFGFVTGTAVVVSMINGNLIVNVKDVRVVIGKIWKTILWCGNLQGLYKRKNNQIIERSMIWKWME